MAQRHLLDAIAIHQNALVGCICNAMRMPLNGSQDGGDVFACVYKEHTAPSAAHFRVKCCQQDELARARDGLLGKHGGGGGFDASALLQSPAGGSAPETPGAASASSDCGRSDSLSRTSHRSRTDRSQTSRSESQAGQRAYRDLPSTPSDWGRRLCSERTHR